MVSIGRGDVNQMSFGFSVEPEGQVWEKDNEGGVMRTLTEVRLHGCRRARAGGLAGRRHPGATGRPAATAPRSGADRDDYLDLIQAAFGLLIASSPSPSDRRGGGHFRAR